MKNIKILLLSILFCFQFEQSFSQTLNFNNLKNEDKHLVSVNAGLDHGLVYGAGYGYQVKSKNPIILNVELSVPSGENVADDFKTKIGAQIRLYKLGNFHFTAKAQGIFRRNENDYVTFQNFGSELSANIGYYKSKWFTAVEFGFDKAIVTHFKHSNEYKQIYPGVQNGWYEPATGGNFNLGLQAGYSFKRSDIFLKGGIVATENFSIPLFPFYAQLGYTKRLKSK